MDMVCCLQFKLFNVFFNSLFFKAFLTEFESTKIRLALIHLIQLQLPFPWWKVFSKIHSNKDEHLKFVIVIH